MNLNRCAAYTIDGAATAMARRVMRRSDPNPNTLDELHYYAGFSVDELFGQMPPDPTLNFRRRWGLRGLSWTDFDFPSPHVPLTTPDRHVEAGIHEANALVHGCWIRHNKAVRASGEPRPTMLFLHSWMQPVSSLEDRLLLPLFARAMDVDVLSMHLPHHGLRKPASSKYHGEYFWTADLVRTFESLRQSVLDARALISWALQNQPGPVGVMGVSLGGMVTLALASVEPRLAFAIPIAAHLDLAGVLEDAALLQPVRSELEAHGWSPSDVEAYTRSLGLYDMQPGIDPERILFVVGEYDRILTTERSRALWQRWGQPPIHLFPGGHLGILLHLRGCLKAARSFVGGLEPSQSVQPA